MKLRRLKLKKIKFLFLNREQKTFSKGNLWIKLFFFSLTFHGQGEKKQGVYCIVLYRCCMWLLTWRRFSGFEATRFARWALVINHVDDECFHQAVYSDINFKEPERLFLLRFLNRLTGISLFMGNMFIFCGGFQIKPCHFFFFFFYNLKRFRINYYSFMSFLFL